MLLHADLTQRAVVHTKTSLWVPSPEAGVERLPLDRHGGELARATSLVRYAPGSRFAPHTHGRGEEFLVLAGEFRDEHGSYPTGTYVRNPWHSHHAPFSPTVTTLFAKLRQIPADDDVKVCLVSVVDTCVLLPGQSERVVVLHSSSSEWVALVRWAKGHQAKAHAHPDGEELFVLDGDLEDEHGTYRAGTWLRQPTNSSHRPFSVTGCLYFVKRGPRG